MVKNFFFSKLGLLIFLVILFVALSYIESNSLEREKTEDKKITDNKSDKKEIIIEEENSREEIKGEVVTTPIPSFPNAPTPTSAPQPSGNIDSFIYPSGSITGKTGTTVNIDSSDNPTDITNWYKEKIKEFDMNATSVVQTSTNGNVLNKIAASNGSLNIEVEISRSNNSQTSKITVKLL